LKNAFVLGLIGLLLVAAQPRAQAPPDPTPTAISEVRASFSRMLDRPRVPLDPRSHEVKPGHHGVVSERLDFAVETRADGSIERVPALVLRPGWAIGCRR